MILEHESEVAIDRILEPGFRVLNHGSDIFSNQLF